MDFAKALSSGSTKSQSAAALFLRSQGAGGYRNLPALLNACEQVDLQQSELTKVEEILVGCGARSLGTILRAVGYDEQNALHRGIVDWLVALTDSRHVQIAGYAVYGLGDLGVPPEVVWRRLKELTESERRPDDHGTITCRGAAFRMLARVDRDAARNYVGSPACKEYLEAMEHWLREYGTRFPQNTAAVDELVDEASWLA